ncbi:hypothetical protein F5Y03DRAFT_341796 [Xylaria venustula]|nr:hypothetical protein F5Y03DRAFT_341796 [Xylaria venustula]
MPVPMYVCVCVCVCVCLLYHIASALSIRDCLVDSLESYFIHSIVNMPCSMTLGSDMPICPACPSFIECHTVYMGN